MSRPWIEFQRGRSYQVNEGGRKDQIGVCVNIRFGHFGRSWGELRFPNGEKEYVRSSHVYEVVDEIGAPR